MTARLRAMLPVLPAAHVPLEPQAERLLRRKSQAELCHADGQAAQHHHESRQRMHPLSIRLGVPAQLGAAVALFHPGHAEQLAARRTQRQALGLYSDGFGYRRLRIGGPEL